MTNDKSFYKLLIFNLEKKFFNVEIKDEKIISFDSCSGINSCYWNYNLETNQAQFDCGDFLPWQRKTDKEMTETIFKIVQETKLEIGKVVNNKEINVKKFTDSLNNATLQKALKK